MEFSESRNDSGEERKIMKYRTMGKTGVEVSALGFGTMRLPLAEDGTVDEQEAVRIIRAGIDSGINYVDTAYGYHNGFSENVVGKALKDGYREKVWLADKCPVWLVEKEGDFERLLDEQLEKLQTDHIDFYLLHALNRKRFEENVKKFSLVERMEEARKQGKIKYIGFSFHDSLDVFEDILQYTEQWDFCQIQYNYINLDYQAGQKGLKMAADRGLGVVIMEPLLGGSLARLSDHVAACLPEGKTPVEYAFDFLWDQPEVSLLLSGMGAMEQVEENLSYADRSDIGMMTQKEKQSLMRAKEIFDRMALVNCTACRYCMPCPFGLDIPASLAAWNMTALDEDDARKAYEALEFQADSCRGCGHCERVCPQHISVSSVMKQMAQYFKKK